MKKAIITILIIGILIVIGGYFFTNSKELTVQTAKSKSHIVAETTNNTSNKPLENQNSQNSTNNSNTNNNSSSNSNNKASTSSLNKKENLITQIENEGTGSFENIENVIESGGYIQGVISGYPNLAITNIHRQGKAMVGTGYYQNNLNAPNTYYIVDLGNGNYKFYEFFNGQNVAISNVQFNKPYGTYQGSLTVVNTGGKIPCTFMLIKPQSPAPFGNSPYYVGEINGTKVTLMQNIGEYLMDEHYAGDNNTFYLQDLNGAIPAPINKYVNNGTTVLTETYKDQVTGYYCINYSGNKENFDGVYIQKTQNGYGNPENISFTGVTTP